MAGLIHPQEREVLLRLECTTLLAIDLVGHDRLCVESVLARPRDGIDNVPGTIPVANPVGIACPDQRVDACRYDITQFIEERSGAVTGRDDFVVGCVRAFLVSAPGADSL